MAKKRIKTYIYVDGSFGNGRAGIGMVIKQKGIIIRQQWFRAFDCSTSSEVEEAAVKHVIEKCKHHYNPNFTTVFTDCKGIINRLSDSVLNVEWIPREENEDAHNMARKGLRSGSTKNKKAVFYNNVAIERTI